MPLTRIIGKRPTYLMSLLFLCVTSIWSFFAGSYGNLLASRIVGGFLSAAADAPVPGVVTDLFYYHQRGHTMMMFNLAISLGAFLGPLINAYIVQYAGWKWMCGVMAIVSGVTFLAAIILIKETAYVTESPRDLDKPESEYAPKRSWLASLSLTAGYDKQASFFAWLFQTITLFAYPPVVIAGLTVGLFIGWYISHALTSFVHSE
jgi:MFS family permease